MQGLTPLRTLGQGVWALGGSRLGLDTDMRLLCCLVIVSRKTLAFSDAQELFDQRQMPSEQRERWRWSAGGASSLDASGGAVG